MPAAPRLVGRDDELATLGELTRALLDGSGGACVVAGPAGIGKTSLVTAAIVDAERAGIRVLRARGSELEGSLSFGAVRDLLGPALLRLPREEQDALLAGPAGFARPILGLGSGDEGDPLYGLFWLTVALAEQQPLLLAVDDLHWLDQESARFLAYLAPRVEGLPILLVATAQTHLHGPAAESMAHLLDATRVVELAPLGPAAVGAMLPEHPAAEVHRLTGGNPMLAVELGRALEAEPGALPSTVSLRGVSAGIVRRIDHQTPEAGMLARAMALSPSRLNIREAAALADLPEADAAAAADALVRAQVLEWDGERIGFLHPVMRRAVYEELDPVGRRTAHARAAAVLRDGGADAETIAAQLLAAAPAGSDETVRILVAAADDAAARRAPRAVASYLERAIAEPPTDQRRRAELRHRLGRVLLGLGLAEATDVLEAALDEMADGRAPVAVDLAHAYLTADRAQDAVDLLQPLLVDTATSEDELDVAATWLLARADQSGDFDGAVLARESGITANLPGSRPVERRALTALAMGHYVAGARPTELRPLVERTLGDLGPPSLFDAARSLLLGAVAMSDERREIAESELRRARHTGETARYAAAQHALAILDNQCGRLREAEASLRLALEAPGIAGWWRFNLESWLATTVSMQGRFDEATAILDAAADHGGPGDEFAQHVDQRRSELAMDRGDYAAVIEPAERVTTTLGSTVAVVGPSVGWDLVVALAAVGQTERAELLARELIVPALENAHPQVLGVALTAFGKVVGGAEGLEALERAVAVLAESPYRWNQANAEVALGRALRAAGKRTRAREVLASALEYAVANDAAPIEKAAREELRLCGARPRRAARTGAASLTPSEERIARLAADGMTNKEIAQHLFVTVKNVEMHLVHAYRKLEVSSRRDLAGVLTDAAAAAG